MEFCPRPAVKPPPVFGPNVGGKAGANAVVPVATITVSLVEAVAPLLQVAVTSKMPGAIVVGTMTCATSSALDVPDGCAATVPKAVEVMLAELLLSTQFARTAIWTPAAAVLGLTSTEAPVVCAALTAFAAVMEAQALVPPIAISPTIPSSAR